jgi:hypothetical protein
MTFKITVAAMALCLAALIHAQTPPAAKPVVTVYKDATCGCCSLWIEHMKASGFEVKALDVEDIDVVKKTYGVPPALTSCHTALVGGYVLEGHVPADSVKRMMSEKPAIAGIAVPGMPAGSPGMEVPGRKDAFSVISFDKTGKQAVYDKH